jgi:hypothetical protein
MLRIHGISRTYDIDIVSSFEDIRSWTSEGVPVDIIYKVGSEQMRARYGYEVGIFIDSRFTPLRSGDFLHFPMDYLEIVMIFNTFPRGVDQLIINYLTSFKTFVETFRKTPVQFFDVFPCQQFNIRRYGKKVSKWELVRNTLMYHLQTKKKCLLLK